MKLVGTLQSAPQSAIDTSSNVLSGVNLGAEIAADEGSVFRFVLAGASNIPAGVLVQSPALIANHLTRTLATSFDIGSSVVAVPLGATATTSGQYQGGKLVVVDGTGAGAEFGIQNNDAVLASGTVTITLEQTLNIALDNTSVVSLIPNLYNGVIINPTSPTGAVVGVTTTAIAAGNYGFVQIYGSCPVLADGAISAGAAISPSNAVAGAVESGVIAQGFVGRALEAGVDTKKHTAFLTI